MLVVAVVAAMIGAPVRAAQLPNAPTLLIEQKYYADGPWAVTTVTAVGCGSSGAQCDLWYPTNLGQNGFRHPIITWGNGTDAVPGQYFYLLSHLASWGFVVVASENVNTGTGQEILDTALRRHVESGGRRHLPGQRLRRLRDLSLDPEPALAADRAAVQLHLLPGGRVPRGPENAGALEQQS